MYGEVVVKSKNRQSEYVQMPDFVGIFGFFEGVLSSPFRRGCFLFPMWSCRKEMQKIRIRQECNKIKTCGLKDPR